MRTLRGPFPILPAVAVAAMALLLPACSGGPPADRASGSDGPYDLVITNGRIVDGTGSPWFHGDIAIRGDRIVRITPRGMLANARAAERIDAEGLVVAPGFIDIQSHSRGAFLGDGDGRVVSKVTQGITTEIMGEGSTNAIINARSFDTDEITPEQEALVQRYGGPRGFDNWLTDMESRGDVGQCGLLPRGHKRADVCQGGIPGPGLAR
jgi:N-acyl-D-amino-acid deacylase